MTGVVPATSSLDRVWVSWAAAVGLPGSVLEAILVQGFTGGCQTGEETRWRRKLSPVLPCACSMCQVA